MMYKASQALSLKASRQVQRIEECMFQSHQNLTTCYASVHHVCLMLRREVLKQATSLLMMSPPYWARQRHTHAATAWDLSSPLIVRCLTKARMPWKSLSRKKVVQG